MVTILQILNFESNQNHDINMEEWGMKRIQFIAGGRGTWRGESKERRER